ncbi:MAG TPA: TonB family protein [Thermoanaerobaculia bacterium]|nr:TonB family protein [Thermoanaerobaculia bacterium]
MSDRKLCVRCERAIDGWAKNCPYCNWDQSKAAPVREAVPAPVAEYKPPEERSVKKLAMYAGGGVLLMIVAFVIGMLINRDGAPEKAPEPISEQTEQAQVSAPKRADTQLIPMNEPGGIEQPITSAPTAAAVPGTPNNEWDRSDATAVSSAEYAQLARRAQAERKKTNPLVDPRSLTGAAYAQGGAPPRRRTASQVAASAPPSQQAPMLTTRPVPQYQPVPRMVARGSARLDLMIGPDGRVQDINVRRSPGGNTAALIGAVQRWRFKPATSNGRPISAPYSVEISFR